MATLPLAGFLGQFHAFAAPLNGKVKITSLKAMALDHMAGNCLIRIDTDAGISGIGEAGATGPIARARIETLKHLLIGKDPLDIGVHWEKMTSLMYNYVAHIPTASGIDIALWDLAGKLLNQPVSVLLGGRFRETIPMYSHGDGVNMLDKGSCKEWAARIRARPEGFTVYKNNLNEPLGVPSGVYAAPLTTKQIRDARVGFDNAREAVGDDIDLAVHAHGELDAPSSIQIAKAVESMNPLWFEDPMNPVFHQGWMDLRRSTTIRILTGEKLEMVRQFRPFLDSGAIDIAHPDLAFSGGITGVKKIADYAALSRTPVALHNVGSLVMTYANAQFACTIQNLFKVESALAHNGRFVEAMAASNGPVVKKGQMEIPAGVGLGLDLNQDYLHKYLLPGEPFWE
ncbi:MAG: mandelate racemase/muconate lactonizing enzyme family protein [Granulicella sp.]